MSLIFVTGAPGSGKSTVLTELKALNYEAFGTDEHGLSQWINRKTNAVEVPPKEFDLQEWYKVHEWALNPTEIAKLKHRSVSTTTDIYMLGVAAGMQDVWHNFDKVFILTADKVELKKRIQNRKDNNFGKTAEELKIVLEWQDKYLRMLQDRGAVLIDTTQLNPSEVAQTIISLAGHHQPVIAPPK